VVIDYGYGATSFVMPNVLSKLGAEVLAINPYVSTAGVLGFDRLAHAEQVAGFVRTSGAHVGIVMSPGGEELTLVDDQARVLSDTECLLALLTLGADQFEGRAVALPVSATSRAGEIVTEAGGTVLHTKISPAALMEAAREPKTVFAAGEGGAYIVADFLPAFDAAATTVSLLERLAHAESTLSQIADSLPEVHLTSETVVTPWEQKGAVMRSLMEVSDGRDVDLVDGVKVHHDSGWVLALPDPEEPITRIWAEGPDDREADRLAQEYARRIRQMVR
jgi:mannose-1-phosphate guanylyltransferase/phosphomannomutase